jgi:AraC-like DNA-binding protein
VAIDLARAEVHDDAGLTLIVNAVRRMPRDGLALTVICPPGPVRSALEHAGLARRMRLADDREALASQDDTDWHAVRPIALGRRQRASTPGARAALLAEATLAIDERHGDPDLSLDAVARQIASSRRQLQRVFAEMAGTSFRDELTAVRMQHAAALLLTTPMPVGVVARRVGYRQPPQFAKAFRRHHGMAPSEFRAAVR